MLPSDDIEERRLSGIGWAEDGPMLLLCVLHSLGGKRPCQSREHCRI